MGESKCTVREERIFAGRKKRGERIRCVDATLEVLLKSEGRKGT